MSELIYLPDVVTLELDAEKCNGCRMCVIVCPHEVYKMIDKRARIVNRDACMECGACALNCETEAITVESGVGCAAAIIQGAILGTEPVCGCSEENGETGNSNACCG
ncbi:MAG: mercury methylation ferredoxin HgcB [Candidatus Electryonea clarkiae]|nr:mercury methylation ferredoxin HgcB [Candidatus Electryonea clarkiae]MDP8286186.1 mercury methylation ferredoxin HgcB [Candidatus Electryonea clarkiae]